MKKNMKYKAALYMRLSKDDGTNESAGIASQRLMLQRYATEHGYDVYDEYVDDGYSGTNYDRPAFLRMKRDIEAGYVNMVIAKDFSRLGRNYIASGELTEVYFPTHFVRFIAINDGYDSARESDDMAPFRHVLNEMYAKDISRKIRSALYAKMEEGQYIGSFAPYGYQKDPHCRNRLTVEESGAVVVRRIFYWAARGKTPKEIADFLNQAAIPIPLDHRMVLQGKEGLGRCWTASGVSKIIRNTAYIGHTAQGKSRKSSFRSKKSQRMPKKMWIVTKNTHEALVNEQTFLAARKRN